MMGPMRLPKPQEKELAVQAMFSSIAHRYDLNNTLLSLGLHHAWKREAVRMSEASPLETVLDLCTGTGDLAMLLAGRVGPSGRVIGLDLNARMLEMGWKKIARRPAGSGPVTLLTGNTERLPFRERTFDAVTIAFGIRNVADMKAALGEIHRVLKPSGRLVCLEFSRPSGRLVRALYHFYSFRILPLIGKLVSGDHTGVYNYLPYSIRAFPDQESFKAMLLEAGFGSVGYRNLTGGIVAIHTALRPPP